MILKLTQDQSARVQKLVRRRCCNCVDGNCLLLDDGEECECVQLISRYGINCNYFLKAVLPTEKKLYEQILRQNKTITDTTSRKDGKKEANDYD